MAKSDKGSARDAAIDQALEKGLESYLLKKIGPRAFADNIDKIITSVIPGARECISTYHVIAESRGVDALTMLVSMKVNELITDARLKDAGVVVGVLTRDKLLLLVKEVDDDKGVSFHWWRSPVAAMTAFELALYAALDERGIGGVKRTFTPEALSEDMTKAELGEEDVIKWGKTLSADLVATGIFRKSSSSRSLFFRLFDTVSGVALSNEIVVRDETGDDGFFPKVADRIAAVASTRQDAKPSPQEFQLVFEGIAEAAQIHLIAKFLKKEVTSVKSLTPTRYSGNSATFRLVSMSSPQSLANQLLKEMPYRVELVRGTDKEVVFRMLGR